MSYAKRVFSELQREDELYRDDPTREPRYGEELDRPEYPWPSDEEMEWDAKYEDNQQ